VRDDVITDKTQLAQSSEALESQSIGTIVVHAKVAVAIGLARLERPVRCTKGEKGEEGLVPVLGRALVKVSDEVVHVCGELKRRSNASGHDGQVLDE
jgi:hypothetical protein